jgi:hypothetical protein
VRSLFGQPSVAVRPNPVFFTLPSDENGHQSSMLNTFSNDDDDGKENQVPKAPKVRQKSRDGLPYRSIFAVLTTDTVFVYDTYHQHPLSIISGLHYSTLNDATWSQDGHTLIVCSTDGFLSIIRFKLGELGEVYDRNQLLSSASGLYQAQSTSIVPKIAGTSRNNEANIIGATITNDSLHRRIAQKTIRLVTQTPIHPPLPPCEPGPVFAITDPPAKRSKSSVSSPSPLLTMTTDQEISHANGDKIQPSLVTNEKPDRKRVLSEGQDDLAVDVQAAVNKMTLQGSGGGNGKNDDENINHIDSVWENNHDYGIQQTSVSGSIIHFPPVKKMKKQNESLTSTT